MHYAASYICVNYLHSAALECYTTADEFTEYENKKSTTKIIECRLLLI